MNQKERLKSIQNNWLRFREYSPEFDRAFQEMPGHAYKAGSLSAKHKRLMAMTAALCSGCPGCYLSQAQKAVELGATAEEIYEACTVAISLGGTMAASESAHVMGYLQDLGMV